MPRTHPTVTIGAGEWRGRVLRYPGHRGVRPSMQRTKNAVFSSLGDDLRGAVFADLFAGAGAVGLEALSRGAARAYFVESRSDALDALAENLKRCGADAGRARVHAATVASVLDARPCTIRDATIVFADPPYDLDLVAEVTDRFRPAEFEALRWFVLEHGVKQTLSPPAGMRIARERRFGDTMVTYMTRAASV